MGGRVGSTRCQRNRHVRRNGLPCLSAAQALERIEHARLARDEAETELAALIDHAVGLGVGWPEIAAQLGVTRQAARQHYQRRHRDGTSLPDRVA